MLLLSHWRLEILALSRRVTSDTQSLSWHHFNSNCEHSWSWIPEAALFECIRRRKLSSSPSMSLSFLKMQDVDAVDTFEVLLCWLVMSNNQTLDGVCMCVAMTRWEENKKKMRIQFEKLKSCNNFSWLHWMLSAARVYVPWWAWQKKRKVPNPIQ